MIVHILQFTSAAKARLRAPRSLNVSKLTSRARTNENDQAFSIYSNCVCSAPFYGGVLVYISSVVPHRLQLIIVTATRGKKSITLVSTAEEVLHSMFLLF